MYEEKKKYLSAYLLQNAVIHRCNLLMECYPEKSAQYEKEIASANALREDIETKIRQTDGEVLSELLLLKYVCGKTLMEISYILNYSLRHTERLHRKALKLFKM